MYKIQWMALFLSGFWARIDCQNEIYCVDPNTGLHYPVNSTWPSSTFCGTYTCNAKLVPKEDGTPGFKKVPTVEQSTEVEPTEPSPEDSGENREKENVHKSRRGDVEVQDEIKDKKNDGYDLDEKDMVKLMELYRVASDLTEAVKKSKSQYKDKFNMIEDYKKNIKNDLSEIDNVKEGTDMNYNQNSLNAFNNMNKIPESYPFSYHDYMSNYINSFQPYYPYSQYNYPQVYSSAFYRGYKPREDFQPSDYDPCASNRRDTYYCPHHDSGMPMSIPNEPFPQSPEGLNTIMADMLRNFISSSKDEVKKAAADTASTTAGTLTDEQIQLLYKHYKQMEENSASSEPDLNPPANDISQSNHIADSKNDLFLDEDRGTHVEPEKQKNINTTQEEVKDVKYYAFDSNDPRMQRFLNDSRVTFFYYDSKENKYITSKGDNYLSYVEFYKDFMSKYPNMTYVSESDPNSKARLHYSNFYNSILSPKEELFTTTESINYIFGGTFDSTGDQAVNHPVYEVPESKDDGIKQSDTLGIETNTEEANTQGRPVEFTNQFSYWTTESSVPHFENARKSVEENIHSSILNENISKGKVNMQNEISDMARESSNTQLERIIKGVEDELGEQFLSLGNKDNTDFVEDIVKEFEGNFVELLSGMAKNTGQERQAEKDPERKNSNLDNNDSGFRLRNILRDVEDGFKLHSFSVPNEQVRHGLGEQMHEPSNLELEVVARPREEDYKQQISHLTTAPNNVQLKSVLKTDVETFDEQISDLSSEYAKFLMNSDPEEDDSAPRYNYKIDADTRVTRNDKTSEDAWGGSSNLKLFEDFIHRKPNPFRRSHFPEMTRVEDVVYKVGAKAREDSGALGKVTGVESKLGHYAKGHKGLPLKKLNLFNPERYWRPEIKRLFKRAAAPAGLKPAEDDESLVAYITVQGCPETLDPGLFQNGEDDKFYPHCCPKKYK